jgi:hypothetical protein
LQPKYDYATFRQGDEGGVELGKTPNKIIVFVIDEYGRTLTKDSMHKLITELFDKALDERSVDVVAVNSPTINNCAYLIVQINCKGIVEWEIIYLHGSKYPPVLLTHEDKEKLTALLPVFNGTSAEAIYKVLTDSGVYDRFK